jgi:hypothetical protein
MRKKTKRAKVWIISVEYVRREENKAESCVAASNSASDD